MHFAGSTEASHCITKANASTRSRPVKKYNIQWISGAPLQVSLLLQSWLRYLVPRRKFLFFFEFRSSGVFVYFFSESARERSAAVLAKKIVPALIASGRKEWTDF